MRPLDSFLVSAKFHRFSIDCKGKRGNLQRSGSNLYSKGLKVGGGGEGGVEGV